MFPNRSPSNLKFLLQVSQDSVELGIILEDIQDRIFEAEWHGVRGSDEPGIRCKWRYASSCRPTRAISPGDIEMDVPWNVRLGRALQSLQSALQDFLADLSSFGLPARRLQPKCEVDSGPVIFAVAFKTSFTSVNDRRPVLQSDGAVKQAIGNRIDHAFQPGCQVRFRG